MDNEPKVSVVMAVNRDDGYLNAAIQSVLNQTYSNFDFYIIANNCSDNLFNDLKSFKDKRIKLYRNNIGQLSFNLNYAINITDADYIARMDADDICLPNRIEQQIKYLKVNSKVDVLGTYATIIDSDGKFIGKLIKPLDNISIRKIISFKNPFCHPSVMIKRDSLLKVGGYLGGRMSEDYSLWLRMARDEKIVFANLDMALLFYRVHSQQSKGMLLAYSEVAGLMLTEFFLKPDFRKFFAVIISILKIFKKYISF